ncbi:energy-coupling factor ABC transporter permease [Actinomycetota bacterium]|jgi:cobalamin biosynthesis protein CbiM
MHIPDGFINAGLSAAAGVGAAGGFAYSLRQLRRYLTERLVPLAALTAAFVFAAQMVNFPVLPGMSGHLIGGVLAAVLVGPAAAYVVMSIVLMVQAFLFADGGLSALGLNIINLGLVAGVFGYYVYRAILRFTPKTHIAVAGSAAVAAFLSVPMAASAFAIEFAIGGTAESVSVSSVLWAMLTTHTVIGIGEGVITFFVVLAVVRARPDLVYGAPDFVGERTEALI